MKRIIFAVLLDVVATIGLLMFLLVPALIPVQDVPGLETTLKGLLCEPQETLHVERYSYDSDDGGTSYSANFYCNYENRQRDVTGRAVLFGVVTFAIPLVVSIGLIISGVTHMTQKRIAATGVYDLEPFGLSVAVSPNEKSSLKERLKQLKQAYDEGLLTEMEYERKRQEILSEL